MFITINCYCLRASIPVPPWRALNMRVLNHEPGGPFPAISRANCVRFIAGSFLAKALPCAPLARSWAHFEALAFWQSTNYPMQTARPIAHSSWAAAGDASLCDRADIWPNTTGVLHRPTRCTSSAPPCLPSWPKASPYPAHCA